MFDSRVKRGVIAVALFLVVLASINFSYAFGVSTPYLENNTLKVVPGGNYTYILTAQNGDAEDYYVDISYSSTDNIANLRKETSYLLSNTFNNSFYFDITIPLDAQIGKVYVLEYYAKQRMLNNSNMTGLEIQRNINILVSGQEDENPTKSITWRIIWMSLLAIIILVLLTLITIRVWRLAKSTSFKIDGGKVTNYTISQAMNFSEVQALLEKMTDDEFRLHEIRKLYKEKISELTTHSTIKNIDELSRRELINAIEKIRLEKTKHEY